MYSKLVSTFYTYTHYKIILMSTIIIFIFSLFVLDWHSICLLQFSQWWKLACRTMAPRKKVNCVGLFFRSYLYCTITNTKTFIIISMENCQHFVYGILISWCKDEKYYKLNGKMWVLINKALSKYFFSFLKYTWYSFFVTTRIYVCNKHNQWKIYYFPSIKTN